MGAAALPFIARELTFDGSPPSPIYGSLQTCSYVTVAYYKILEYIFTLLAPEIERTRDRDVHGSISTPFDDVIESNADCEESARSFLSFSEQPVPPSDLSAETELPVVKVDEAGFDSFEQLELETEDATQSDGNQAESAVDQKDMDLLSVETNAMEESQFVTPTNQSFECDTPGAPLAVDPRNLSPDDFRAGRDRPRSRSMPATLEAGVNHLSPVSLYRKFNWGQHLEDIPDGFVRLDLTSKAGDSEANVDATKGRDSN